MFIDRRLLFVLFAGMVTSPRLAMSEFSQGLGKIADGTKKASTNMGDAFKLFFQMDVEIVQGKFDNAEHTRKEVVALLNSAASAYEASEPDGHILNPILQNDEEKGYADYFFSQAPKYGLKPPFTQRGVIEGTARLVRNFTITIKAADIRKLSHDIAGLQRLANQCADIQKFLVAATTMLTG